MNRQKVSRVPPVQTEVLHTPNKNRGEWAKAADCVVLHVQRLQATQKRAVVDRTTAIGVLSAPGLLRILHQHVLRIGHGEIIATG